MARDGQEKVLCQKFFKPKSGLQLDDFCYHGKNRYVDLAKRNSESIRTSLTEKIKNTNSLFPILGE